MLTFKNQVLIKSVIFHYTLKKINHICISPSHCYCERISRNRESHSRDTTNSIFKCNLSIYKYIYSNIYSFGTEMTMMMIALRDVLIHFHPKVYKCVSYMFALAPPWIIICCAFGATWCGFCVCVSCICRALQNTTSKGNKHDNIYQSYKK